MVILIVHGIPKEDIFAGGLEEFIRDMGSVLSIQKFSVLQREMRLALPQGGNRAERPIVLFVDQLRVDDGMRALGESLGGVVRRYFKEVRMDFFGGAENRLSLIC